MLDIDPKRLLPEERLLNEICLLFQDANQQNNTQIDTMKKNHLSEVEVEWPLLDPKDLRRELFKYFYCQQQIEKFGLYAKADAAEFM